MTNSKTRGYSGEKIAQNYLIKRGCKILAQNFHSRYGEIDIIALEATPNQQEKTLLFIEVKYRRHEYFATAADAITPQKQERMRLTIETYLQQYPTALPLRIDLITIVGEEPFKIEWLKNIF
ncbi:YraN family protein [Ignatzschineria cameli]|uniref:UPF0102 protein DC077_10410 n=1 Tax=Ignatzschineria cameli TaxID=2182793 RepID=A0A2U2AJJ7_9GAMM|nr:YraN family protein [Ignatzschineria cameli]PWD82836.1 YraN family protein [Ignatzschineria cameli]PWD82872.1 YraN family protein [Ignatzschineria cameli]PWD87242.1 YraN family protein [Ignatzschineria cameli]PWD88538.1 YraN family protein [Ignatzschineria cameli]PWD88805.1 YraN family protein [Ignatzschineria cameli]